ncbi:hypothetical protein PPL_03318 [Heterostelium album PN500]|uniref:Uncharacterized protein n=1 Tax=Heterostelium pallidum (strain ATCC 26659 / Pp 5 / PN500) TaxID=670386 RepID=D3B4J3_HETP5|nr:hypothetical protein PPL_03318 [Heterostelium album PN500]EFA84241.1 hypothetical protein PPL_03318 [Heterostelium album PN500]|eukprot:XP_020436357.1 hypothetical protein PPL_03318 [Heterostelium album PN500]
MNNSQQTFTRDELIEFTKDKLFKICLDNNIKVSKSTNKSLIIDHIINFKEEKDRLQKKLIDDNPSNQFHRGHVEYKLPVMIITKILQLSWNISTSDRYSPLFSYREALKLTSINKSSEMVDHIDRLTSVWCPIKHIVKLMINTHMFEHLMKQQSAHLTHILSTVEKLHIHHEKGSGRLSMTSIQFLGITAKPRSLHLRYINLEYKEMNAICSIKSLRKLEIWHKKDCSDYFAVLCKGLPLLESLKSHTFNISCIPKSSRSAIKKLSEVCLYETDETFEFPNLQMLTLANYTPISTDTQFSRYFSQSNNITYLSIYLNSYGTFDHWIPIIIQLKSLVTLEDLARHSQRDGVLFNSKLKDIILPASLSRIIISTNDIFEANNYLIDIGYQHSQDITLLGYYRKMIFNKLSKCSCFSNILSSNIFSNNFICFSTRAVNKSLES